MVIGEIILEDQNIGHGVMKEFMVDRRLIKMGLVMQKNYIMTSSDGHVQVPGESKPHPRSYGAFTRKIRKYVLEDQIITMEHAIRAATALPARMLGLTDRGMIEVGAAADLVVFDPENIRDKATFSDPHQYSEGINYLLVNGKIVIEEGAYNGTLAGKAIRNNHESK